MFWDCRNGQISSYRMCTCEEAAFRFIALPDLLKSAPCFKVATQKTQNGEAAAQLEGRKKRSETKCYASQYRGSDDRRAGTSFSSKSLSSQS
jgi:hypothetical protein